MNRPSYLIFATLLGLVVASCTVKEQRKAPDDHSSTGAATGGSIKPTTDLGESSQINESNLTKVRFATFNVSMNRKQEGQLNQDLQKGTAIQIRRVAEVIQRVRPDVVLLNEFDYDPSCESIKLFQKKFLAVSQNSQKPIQFKYSYSGPVNTGINSNLDLNGDGKTELPNDGFGFGAFPGQYGMVVLSNYPINLSNLRTFQKFLWKDMPGSNRPTDPATQKSFHPDATFAQMRLSSKSHWDLPIQIGAKTVHLICSHPTPPVFDGPEDRNGCRNHDEIRMIADYVTGDADYLYDDNGTRGGLASAKSFVIVGDLNADPFDGDSNGEAARQLTALKKINLSSTPFSAGGKQASSKSGKKNKEHKGNPSYDTGDFNDEVVGNMRVDYCLPSVDLKILDCGVFWPADGKPGSDLNQASDHHLVWADLEIAK